MLNADTLLQMRNIRYAAIMVQVRNVRFAGNMIQFRNVKYADTLVQVGNIRSRYNSTSWNCGTVEECRIY
jgi:hypothetical protein